ncbi:MAG: NrdH-redoxin [Candidatus Zambryskibacteria bacterium RIFCSPLOWO2_01_FULL_39_39]|uniref:NrdH-redoxin n=1 Tax=Candidatus Zambryskibacteria bacterium RIFCSPLOWO2_01_FULL_39_39 TaxID=1802758 RepID=A0A1G2TWP3_9BACT|nr:MAG: Glutaredoxin-like protein, YruB-family [Parcubacteria group bacterium GW2011_GWA1_38_7]OHA87329.1 MAG: NrdH-redoxin [Candidatus Zambryskibacteria bacterium RIFCSPHIGHO2_01_FULL_39_63]OHA95304.1 MAG: NrdH-redoxin [Candidatus Zambryskibacteria bacterium RIFCSPHIGHO2_02_FULL_39_19]OHA98882.1 MAG: NrdH-redoxin [Candidatus Zambryskibacteria bacterium RIFCSPHIGHO2_12_FULL_39_21]OHB01735.1 MAG: NrdH-redoxin [Candidatus Zambryskibacteria bacterium RIFCSPLOWO2_01_FULL_39_39]
MNKDVIIYSTPTCHYCHLAKEFFKEQGIAYTEYDVLTDLEKRKEMVDKSGQLGVPVISIDGKVVVGFDQGEISSLLGI